MPSRKETMFENNREMKPLVLLPFVRCRVDLGRVARRCIVSSAIGEVGYGVRKLMWRQNLVSLLLVSQVEEATGERGEDTPQL